MDDDAAYLALKARDARFDGRLFVGVTSTGIYCRPVCRVRTPRRENCRFFASAPQAEAAAFRPCLKCRPEIAPGLSAMDSSAVLAGHAARALVDAVHAGQPLPLPALAARLGVTDRHLRRIFQAAHGVSPQGFVTTQRLLLAKRLLTDTDAPVTQVALASGFASLRRFNAAFAERYRMPPSRLRREGAPAGEVAAGAATAATAAEATAAARRPARTNTPRSSTLRLAWRPPYDVDAMTRFLAARALPGVEQVEGLALRRTLALPHGGATLAGWIECRWRPERHELHLATDPALTPALGTLLQRVRQALDLDADPARMAPVLARLPLPPRPGLRLPGAFDGFELAVRAILGQQVTVAAARTLARRLVEAFGQPLATPFPGLDRLFPAAALIAGADADALGRLGIVRQRVRALQALAHEVAAGRLALHPGAPLQATLDALRALPGVGDWTAQLIAMRALAWPDAFPATDIGLLNALGTRDVEQVRQQAEAWRPWRAYAVIRLWQTLETPA
jgi:AraC family transcriptional regulator of adaptative response / DNA-3-methyladenine glycosylase II